jgi:glutathione S-transferase
MIIVHHLNDSRSQRILWLLEELNVPYEIKRYQRDAQTRLAPPELKAVHPLGKSPVITDTDNGRVIAESGAIIDYILRRHGNGRLQPNLASAVPCHRVMRNDGSFYGRHRLGTDRQRALLSREAAAKSQGRSTCAIHRQRRSV